MCLRPEHFLFAAVPVVQGRRSAAGRGPVRRDQQKPGGSETLHRVRGRLCAKVQPGQILPGLRGPCAPEERGRKAAEKTPALYAFRRVKSPPFQGFFRMVGGEAGQIIKSPPEPTSKCVGKSFRPWYSRRFCGMLDRTIIKDRSGRDGQPGNAIGLHHDQGRRRR